MGFNFIFNIFQSQFFSFSIYRENSFIFVISMVDLVGINVLKGQVVLYLNLRHPRLWSVGPTRLGLRCEVAVGPSRPTPADSRVLVVR